MNNKVNFFVIGQPKTGTTSLFHYLKKHPQIFLPEQKQLYHFARDHNAHRMQFKQMNRKYYRQYYNYTYESYIKRFPIEGRFKIYGDITPDYFYSIEAPYRIYDYNPDAFVLAIIREPVSFLKSFHFQMINSGKEKEKNFAKALELGRERKKKPILQDLCTPSIFFQYKSLAEYTPFIMRYHKLFGNKFKIIIYEDFKNDNIKYLDMLQRELGIDSFSYNYIISSNPSREVSGKFRIIRKSYILRLLSSTLPWSLKRKIKGLIENNRFTRTNTANQQSQLDETQLKRQLKNHIKELDAYINKHNLLLTEGNEDLASIWGYNDL